MVFNFKIFVLVLALAGCQKKANKSSKEGANYPHPNSPTSGMTNVQPAGKRTLSKAVAPSAETVLTLGSTTVTIPEGALSIAATASLTSYAGGFLNSGSTTMVSEPLLLEIVDMTGTDVDRAYVVKDIKVEMESAAKVTSGKIVVLFNENGGLATSTKTGIAHSVLSPGLTATTGGKYKATFNMRLPRTAMVMATTSGGLPADYTGFVAPPSDVTDLAGSPRSPSTIRLTWKADTSVNKSFAVVLAAGGSQIGECSLEDVVSAQAGATSGTFYYDVSDLNDGVSYTFKVCATSYRTPADLTSGEQVVAATPARARATLTNAPSGTSNLTALNVTVGGSNVVDYRYALLTNQTDCTSATYSAWTPVATHITDALPATGSMKLCVLGRIDSTNEQLVATTASWDVDLIPPTFTSIALAGDATDLYVNNSEKINATAIVGSLSASGHDGQDYIVVTSATSCNGPLAYASTVPVSASLAAMSDSVYKVCVRLFDNAGNFAYGASNTFTIDFTVPVFTALNLTLDASDGYINDAEKSLTNNLTAAVSGSGYLTAEYKAVVSSTNCDGLLTYGASIPKSDDTAMGTDGTYKVCVRLVDVAQNITYGVSSTITRKTTLPTFASLPLGSDVSDGYLSIAESAMTNALASGLSGSNYDSASYIVVTSSTTCDGSLNYGAMPTDNNSAIDTHNQAYKVCARLSDNAGNPSAFGSSSPFTALISPPSCGGVTLSGDATDGYINGNEHGNAVAVTSGVSGGSATVAGVNYAVMASNATCNGGQTFGGAAPKSDHSAFDVNGTYKICARVADAASQYGYCASSDIVVDISTITFTSLDLTGPAADSYINSSEHATSSAIVANLVGSNYDSVDYAVVSGATTCDGLVTYGSGVPAADHAAISSDGASYKICARLTDLAGNTPAYGASQTLTFDNSAPAFTSLALINAASDGYLNLSESALNTVVAGSLSASGHSTVQYALVTSATTCAFPLSWVGSVAQANDALFTTPGAYKICVQLTDVAGNITYGFSADINFDNVAPVFTSVALANDAVDTYISIADAGGSSAVVASLVGSGYTGERYAVATNASNCSSSGGYSASIPVGTDFSGLSGDYKVCVELSDLAGNLTFGASDVIHADNAAPTATLSGAPAGTNNDTTLDVTVGGAGVTEYQYDLVSGTDCTGASYGSWTAVATHITEAPGADGNKILCVIGRDAATNAQATATTASWTKDTVAPTATLTGAPTGANNATSLDVTVGGAGVTEYQYDLVSGTDCTGASYGSWTAVATHITEAPGADGNKILCVIGRDTATNAQATATTAAWTKDTVTPTLAFASGLPGDPSKSIILNVAISTTDTTTYKYAVITGDNTGCSGATLGGDVAVSTNITDNISGFADGQVTICAKATDAAGNAQSTFTSYTWTKDTAAPALFSFTGPSSPTSSTTPTITWSAPAGDVNAIELIISKTSGCGSNVIESYLLSGGTYSALAGNAASQAVSAALSDGTVYLCAYVYDVALNQSSVITGSFELETDTVHVSWFADSAIRYGNKAQTAAWTTETVDSGAGTYVGRPSLALDSSGNAYVSYSVNNSGTYYMRYRKRTGVSTWDAASTVNSAAVTGVGYFNELGIDSAGTVVSAFFGNDGTNSGLFVGADTTAGSALITEASSANIRDMAIAVGTSDSRYAVMSVLSGSDYILKIANKTTGLTGTVTLPTNCVSAPWVSAFAKGSDTVIGMAIACLMSNDNTCHVQYGEATYTGSGANFTYSAWTDVGTIKGATCINTDLSARDRPSLVYDRQNSNKVSIAWRDQVNNQIKRWTNESGSNATETVLTGVSTVGTPTIALDATGKSYIVYSDNMNVKFVTNNARAFGSYTGGWSTPVTISSPTTLNRVGNVGITGMKGRGNFTGGQ